MGIIKYKYLNFQKMTEKTEHFNFEADIQ